MINSYINHRKHRRLPDSLTKVVTGSDRAENNCGKPDMLDSNALVLLLTPFPYVPIPKGTVMFISNVPVAV